jgi:hypothetical protein
MKSLHQGCRRNDGNGILRPAVGLSCRCYVYVTKHGAFHTAYVSLAIEVN